MNYAVFARKQSLSILATLPDLSAKTRTSYLLNPKQEFLLHNRDVGRFSFRVLRTKLNSCANNVGTFRGR